jgi:hypothetical protein
LKSLTVVTRTLGDRQELLDRTISSVKELKSKWAPWVDVRHLIVGPDYLLPNYLEIGNATFLPYTKTEGVDSRWDAIEHAMRALDSDFVQFLDDDDWLQLGESMIIPQEIAESKYDSYWIPGEFSGQGILHRRIMRLLGSRFTYDPKYFHLSVSPRVNLTPFPCVIYRTSLVQAAVREISVLSPVFREDHLVFVFAAGRQTRRIDVGSLSAQIDISSNGRATLPYFRRGPESARVGKFLRSQLISSNLDPTPAGLVISALPRLRILISRFVIQITS